MQKIRPVPVAVGKLRLLVPPLVMVAFLVFASTPAFAAKTHHLVKIFTGAAAPGHGFGGYLSLGVDESAENLFVGSTEGNRYRIDITGPEGEEPSGVASPFAIDVHETGPAEGFGSHEGVAVDNSPTSPSKGTLYVAEAASHEVKKFTLNPLSEEYEQTGTLSATTPLDVAVDTKGNVFVADGESESIAKFSPTGSALGQIPVGFAAMGVAVDGQGNLYVQEAFPNESALGKVIEFPAGGSGEIEPGTQPIEVASGTGTSFKDNPRGIAVDQSANELYVVFRDRVEQFDAGGNRVGEFELPNGSQQLEGRLIAVNGQSGLVYVFGAVTDGGSSPGIGVFGPSVIAPDATTEAVSNLTVTSATLNGTVSAAAGLPATCEFEYADDASFKAKGFEGAAAAPCSPAGPFTGSTAEPVSAAVAGLATQTFYHYRLVASSADGTTRGKALRFFTPGPPFIDGESVSGLTGTSATLEALVNPASGATSYVFEYVTEADFEASGYANAPSVPLGGEEIGSGFEAVAVSQAIAGLTLSTSYVFRVVATNPLGTKPGPDQLFTTLGIKGFELPDGRVFEQATPVDKNGTAPTGGTSLVQAASEGDGITYSSGGGIPGAEGAQQYPNYLASRSADWSNQGLFPPAGSGSSAAVLGWSEDLSQSYSALATQPADPASFLARDSATGVLRTIASGGGNALSSPAFIYDGAARDGSIVVFESDTPLPPGGAAKAFNTYAWNRETNELSLVGILPNGAIPKKGSAAGANGGSDHYTYTQAQHVVSEDGSHVFFNNFETGRAYLRLNPTAPEEDCAIPSGACTLSVSASKRTIPPLKDEKPAVFQGATPDGSLAFFISSGKLTNDATTGPAGAGKDLYRWQASSGELTDLAPDLTDPNGAEVKSVLGISDDGAYVYFAASGKLGSAPSAGNCDAGLCNLYLWHAEGAGGSISFIAQVGDSDKANWASLAGSGERSSRVSADGQTLLFSSRQKLGAYDNHGAPELYRYRIGASQQLACVSCNPTGAAPLQGATLQNLTKVSNTVPQPAAILPRNLSVDGNRVFFETPDKLVASDTNGDGSCRFLNEVNKGGARACQDVYEWEAKGSGSCRSNAQNGGCLYLLSSGTSPEPSYFADADVRGENAFIFTTTQLVGQDKDQITDIYDARIGGGIASQNPPPPPPICEGEACKGPAPASPPSESAGSAGFSGPGDPKPSRRGKTRHHKKKQHKSHHKKSRATHGKHG